MVTATTSVAQAKRLFASNDLRSILAAAAKIALIGGVASDLPRSLTRAELQLVTACNSICELIEGSLARDAEEPLVLRESPVLPVTCQLRLMNSNGR